MNKFSIEVKFKNGSNLGFELGSDDDIRKKVSDSWSKSLLDGGLQLGDHIMNPKEILWMKIKGDIIAKPSGKELPNIREKKQ